MSSVQKEITGRSGDDKNAITAGIYCNGMHALPLNVSLLEFQADLREKILFLLLLSSIKDFNNQISLNSLYTWDPSTYFEG